MQDVLDELEALRFALDYKILSILRFPITVFRWILVIVVPIVLGAYVSVYIEKAIEGDVQSFYDIKTVWPLATLVAFYSVGQIWRVNVSERKSQLERIIYALRWFYNDLGLGKNKENDVRCTIWSPIDSNLPPEKIKLIQLVDYIPEFEKNIIGKNVYRVNKRAGRTRPITRINNGTAKPIGITGKCAFESLRDHNPYIMFENIEDSDIFCQRMTAYWNFSKADVKSLTKDRRSYMSIALMDAGQTHILGIIYLDAKEPKVFTKELGDKAQKYLPRIAELLAEGEK